MFTSFFSTSAPVDPNAPTLHPVTSKYGPNELFGELEPKDNEWLATSSGFVTETQTWYHFLEDGTSVMCQVIHSSVGVWYPTIQFTCKIYNPTTKDTIWKSINVSNFVTPPPGLDRRSSKADQFTITHKSTGDSESYKINANLGDDLQIALDVTRPAGASGFKLGRGPEGGYTNFGADASKPDGYVIHRFWPHTIAGGHFVHNGRAIMLENRPGMFVHAIQGMRPNLVATRWNFAHFQSAKPGEAAAIMMEYTTQPEYGLKGAGSGGVTVNIGGVLLNGKLVAITGETKLPGETLADKAEVMSRALHIKPVQDPDTGYDAPTGLVFTWAAPSIANKDMPCAINATLEVDVGGPSAETSKGLIEKVDVLAEIPYVLKTMVNYVAGTKPYIYQWVNPAKLVVTGPEALVPGGSTTVDGLSYNEATYI